jgi:hypothetical protein
MIGTDAESRAKSGERDTSFVGMIIQKPAGTLDGCCFGIDSEALSGLRGRLEIQPAQKPPTQKRPAFGLDDATGMKVCNR